MPLAEHDRKQKAEPVKTDVSIHVPLAEHDIDNHVTLSRRRVSIHVPLAEHDTSPRYLQRHHVRFNSRAPRGARRFGVLLTEDYPRFNSRAPRGARQIHTRRPVLGRRFQFTCPSRSTTKSLLHLGILSVVSIHVPLAEHDSIALIMFIAICSFQFTCPSRSTTCPSGFQHL